MNSINSSGAVKEQKTHSQKKNSGKDRHELENCRQLKNKLARECAAMQSIETEESLNLNRH